MELLEYRPQTAPSFFLPAEEIILCPIGDIQYGSQGCELDRLKSHIAWAEDLRKLHGKKVYYVGMGDYVDVASPSNRKRIQAIWGDLYDSMRETITTGAEKYTKDIMRILEPTKGRWLGLLSGHHYWEFPDGTNIDSRLAQYLETNYLGSSTLMHVRFKTRRAQDSTSAVCKIWAHHGEGSGQSVAAPINKVMQRAVPYWFAHIYLVGHYHSKSTQPIPWIDTVTNKNGEVIMRGITRYIVSTGGWLAGYAQSAKNAVGLPEGNYVEKAMLAPHTLGAPVIFIRPRRSGGVDINVSV